jgi:hypothetical protein
MHCVQVLSLRIPKDAQGKTPHHLPGCTEWERGVPADDLAAEQARNVGVLWVCKIHKRLNCLTATLRRYRLNQIYYIPQTYITKNTLWQTSFALSRGKETAYRIGAHKQREQEGAMEAVS